MEHNKVMPICQVSKLVLLLVSTLTAGCATTRQIAVDYPKTQADVLKPLPGSAAISGDDYYVQLVSEFDFKGDSALKSGCGDMGTPYERGDLSAAVIFNVHNDPLKFKRDASGFLYQATTGKCNFRLETKKAYLTPWLRLDAGKDTAVEYSFLTSNSHEANLSQLIGDVNAASNLLALTGVGTGIAIMGKVAGNWVANNQASPQPDAHASAKYSSEIHSLPSAVTLSGDSAALHRSSLAVYEVSEGGANVFGSESRLLGELDIYPEITPTLLLKLAANGLPDAHDLSLDELWRTPIQSSGGQVTLQQLIGQTEHPEKPNLQPNPQHYAELETQCRKLKLVMKDLGFNKFDRNALLYYFLLRSDDWKNFNITAQRALTDELRPKMLEKYRSGDFAGCLAKEDYIVMKSMGLTVNTEQDWDNLTSSRQKKDTMYSPVLSAGRQLTAALKNPDKDEMARQLYPLLATADKGNGSVLLQNHLGNFGLEGLLEVPAIADEGVTVTSQQLANAFAKLSIDDLTCARTAQQQDQPLPNIGLILFATKEGSPRAKGGAIEFELVQGKIVRLAFQHASFRDFAQDVQDYPDRGGCRIESIWLDKLR